jgi:N-acetyl-gamma-glutamyl-phosphate reductase
MIKASIVGATGYAGEELVRILSAHPQVEVAHVTSHSFTGQRFDSIYRNFKSRFPNVCEEENIEKLAEDSDVIFMALPHGMVSNKINENLLKKTKIIDIGADFRIKSQKVYEEWYKTSHESPEFLEEAVYGLCEWKKEEIKKARLLANPGCYTTCSILSLSPLVKEKLIDLKSIVIDAKSGVTGAGRTLDLSTHFTECNETTKAYKIASHRHTPEIEQELSLLAGKDITLSFTPHLIPMQRGILATCYANLLDTSLTYEDIIQVYLKYYGESYFIRLTEKGVFPETKWVRNSNYCDIGFAIDRRCGRIIVVGAIDNLIKGAAGQAVQNMNIMFGIDEMAGLESLPVSL